MLQVLLQFVLVRLVHCREHRNPSSDPRGTHDVNACSVADARLSCAAASNHASGGVVSAHPALPAHPGCLVSPSCLIATFQACRCNSVTAPPSLDPKVPRLIELSLQRVCCAHVCRLPCGRGNQHPVEAAAAVRLLSWHPRMETPAKCSQGGACGALDSSACMQEDLATGGC